MIIKDPYLASNKKPQRPLSMSVFPGQSIRDYPEAAPYATQGSFTDPVKYINELRLKLMACYREKYQLQYYRHEQYQAARKMLNYQQSNYYYHYALKTRNLYLNNKLNYMSYQFQQLTHRHYYYLKRICYDKDILLQRYEYTTAEISNLKRNINQLLDHKTRLEEQVTHLTFLVEKEADRGLLELREQAIRMENLYRTYSETIACKDEYIMQLAARLRIYEDYNRRLGQLNRTMQLTKEKIDNLSQIQHADSLAKSAGKDAGKEGGKYTRKLFKEKENRNKNEFGEVEKNDELESAELQRELLEQMRYNKQMEKYLKELKKNARKNDRYLSSSEEREGTPKRTKKKSKKKDIKANPSKSALQSQVAPYYTIYGLKGFLYSMLSLRYGITKYLFEVFCKSVQYGDTKKQNSLAIFIENWKCVQIDRIHPYVQSYLQAREALKSKDRKDLAKRDIALWAKVEETVPLGVGTRANRSSVNQWVLSTIQHTKNQRYTSKNNLNNDILFLFRLLTIEYRMRYPMQGKSYDIDSDVRNELHHEIAKGVKYIIDRRDSK